MADSTTLSVRISKSTKERLARLAESTKRSQAFLAAEAIEEFVEINEWQVAHIEQAIAEADSGGTFVAHEDVTAWVEARGSENELPPLEPTLRRKWCGMDIVWLARVQRELIHIHSYVAVGNPQAAIDPRAPGVVTLL